MICMRHGHRSICLYFVELHLRQTPSSNKTEVSEATWLLTRLFQIFLTRNELIIFLKILVFV